MFPKQVRPKAGETDPEMTYRGVPWRRGISRDRDGGAPRPAVVPSSPEPVSICMIRPPSVWSQRAGVWSHARLFAAVCSP